MYNVFKRPMFKRGGSTQGTGIMSYVEPRVKAASGFGFLFPGQNRQPLSQQQIDAFKAANERPAPNFQMSDLFPRLDPNYDQKVKEYGSILAYNRAQKEKLAPLKDLTGVEIGMMGDDGITGYDYTKPEIVEQVANIQAGIASLEKEKGYYPTKEKQPIIPTKKEPEYKGTDIRAEVEKEASMIKDLLKDEGYSKGELALLIAGAVSEPGSIGDKLDKARELAIPLARQKRKEDKAVTLTAYQLAKAKEKEQIKAGKGTPYLQNIRAVARATANQPGETRSEKEIENALLSSKGPGSAERLDVLGKLAPNLLEAESKIRRLNVELREAKAKGSKKDIKRIQSDIERQLSEIKGVAEYPELDLIIPGLKNRLGLNKGGRVMRAVGTPEQGEQGVKIKDDIISSDISFGSGSATTSEPVQQLSYRELRDRLPPEITDDVVNLLANNAEALQSFAYITTQDDINAFNVKYGVNLVVPPTRT